MEKTFAFGISSMVGAFAFSLTNVAGLFGQVDDNFAKFGTEAGIAVLITFIFYKIAMKSIDVFGTLLVNRIDRHDQESGKRLDEIQKGVDHANARLDGWENPQQ